MNAADVAIERGDKLIALTAELERTRDRLRRSQVALRAYLRWADETNNNFDDGGTAHLVDVVRAALGIGEK